MMGWIIAGVILPSCLVTAWFIVRKPLRRVVEEIGVDQARFSFHQRREWLEAGFLTALAKLDPIERLRWESAHWNDQVHWARDHESRRLLALVEILFENDPFEGAAVSSVRHATALFEYRKGRWYAEGHRLDATRPDDIFQQLGPFEPLHRQHRRA